MSTDSQMSTAETAMTTTAGTAASFGVLKQIDAGLLSVGYAEAGPPGSPAVILLHGWPYDIHSYAPGTPLLAAAGYRVIVPYLRGYGTTRFLAAVTFRNGQQAALAVDVVALMDALGIDRAIIGGFDWGARTANVVAALWPQRCRAIVSVSGYLIGSQTANQAPLPPQAELQWWYQYYLATERGRVSYDRHRREFARLIWRTAPPRWDFDDATFDRSAASLDNARHGRGRIIALISHPPTPRTENSGGVGEALSRYRAAVRTPRSDSAVSPKRDAVSLPTVVPIEPSTRGARSTMTEIGPPRHAASPTSATPQMEPDILPGFLSETIALRPDDQGEVVATLVVRRAPVSTDKAVLYVHGYCDYFFNVELADRYNEQGFDFYAIDLRKYGRSLRPHQTPYLALSLDEYFEELDAAVDRIRNRDGHTFLLYNGHSTGGLTGSLYADARRDVGTIDAIFLNSPFFDMNASWLAENALIPLAAALGKLRPNVEIPSTIPRLWGESIHKDHRGEWDFRLDWKPIQGPPVQAGLLRALRTGQGRLQKGLQIEAPVLVMFSTESSWPKEWSEVFYRTDSVLDVADIDRYSDGIGRDVTKVRILDGVHDLALSARPVREKVYRELFDWTGARGF